MNLLPVEPGAASAPPGRSPRPSDGGMLGAALAVGVGLVVLGVSSYAFLVLAGRALGPARFAPVSTLYLVVYTVGPGLFLPVEQEVARASAARREAGQGAGPLLVRAGVLTGALTALAVLSCAAAAAPLTHRLLGGEPSLLLALLVATPVAGASYWSRGVLAGAGGYAAYGRQLALEGAVRLFGCALLVGLQVHTVGPYGGLIALAPLLALLVTLPPRSVLREPGPPAPWAELSRALGWLLGGALASQALANLAPVIVNVLARPQERAAVGSFLAGLVLVRVPLFLFAAVQAAFLPTLARHVAADRRRAFGRIVAQIAGLLTVGSALVVAGCAAAGGQAVQVVFGGGFTPADRDLAVLAAASGVYAVATVCAQALLALRHYRTPCLTWLVGCGAFGLALLPARALAVRVGDALLVGSLAALAVAGGGLIWRLRAWQGAAPTDRVPS